TNGSVDSTSTGTYSRGLLPLWSRMMSVILTSDRRSPRTNNVICLRPPDGPRLRVTGLGTETCDIVQEIVPSTCLPRSSTQQIELSSSPQAVRCSIYAGRECD